jgi:hypothetical protein
VAGIVRYGQEKTREFRADVDPELVGHVALAAYVGVVVHQHLYRESLSYDPITTVLHTLMRDGVKARAESTPAPRASAPRARRKTQDPLSREEPRVDLWPVLRGTGSHDVDQRAGR